MLWRDNETSLSIVSIWSNANTFIQKELKKYKKVIKVFGWAQKLWNVWNFPSLFISSFLSLLVDFNDDNILNRAIQSCMLCNVFTYKFITSAKFIGRQIQALRNGSAIYYKDFFTRFTLLPWNVMRSSDLLKINTVKLEVHRNLFWTKLSNKMDWTYSSRTQIFDSFVIL